MPTRPAMDLYGKRDLGDSMTREDAGDQHGESGHPDDRIHVDQGAAEVIP